MSYLDEVLLVTPRGVVSVQGGGATTAGRCTITLGRVGVAGKTETFT